MVAPARSKLRPQWERFIDAYITNGGKAYAAAIAAGYAVSGARVAGYRLLTTDAIAEEIARRRALVQRAASIEAVEVIEELSALARSDVTDIVAWNGHGLVYEASRDLPPEVTAAIKEVREIRKIHRSKDGSEDETIDFRIVMHDKIAPLLGLARMLGLDKVGGGDTYIDARQQVVMTGPEMLEAVQRVYGLEAGNVIEGEAR